MIDRSWVAWLAGPVIAAGTGCSPLGPAVPLESGPAPVANRVSYSDGGEAIFYTIDKGGGSGPMEPDSVVFVVAGSGCVDMGRWLPEYFRGLEGGAGPLRIFVMHKRFIGTVNPDGGRGCSQAFTRADHPKRWLSDYVEFMNSRLAIHRPRRIVLVGISEGGEVVPALARRIAGVTHLVLLASAGMDPIEAFQLQARRNSLEGAHAIISAARAPAPPDPDEPQTALGDRSWRYWSELGELRPVANLLALDIPILVGMGEEDRLMPIEAAWRMRDRFALAGKDNLTVLVYPDADHALFDRRSGRSRLLDFWGEVDRWLAR